MFESYLEANMATRLDSYRASRITLDEDEFKKKIIDLRILKYGRVLAKKMKSSGVNVKKIFIKHSEEPLNKKHDIASGHYLLLIEPNTSITDTEIITVINEIISVPPLSKFGISSQFLLSRNLDEFAKLLPNNELFIYSQNNTHQFVAKPSASNSFIYSTIAVNINEEIYRNTK